MLVENREAREVVLFYLSSKVIFHIRGGKKGLFNLLEFKMNITTRKTVQLCNCKIH